MLRKLTYLALSACLLLLITTAATPSPQEQAASGEKKDQKVAKDQKEYELITSVFKESDPQKRLQLLDEWSKEYPDTAFQKERIQNYMATYQAVGQNEKTIETAKKILQDDPQNFPAHFTIVSLVQQMGSTDATSLADAEKSSKALLDGILDKQFTAANKPANIPQAEWDSTKRQIELTCHQTIGWVAMQRKNHIEAEKKFVELLGMNPNNGQVSYWLGNVVLAQGNADKNELALFSFARASVYEGEGSLNPQGRQQVDAYLTKVYTRYAGTEDGLPELKQMAKTRALPPADLKIKSAEEREFEADQKARRENPLRYVFIDLRDRLLGPEGNSIWADLQGKLTPEMRLFVVSSSPPDRPTSVNLSSERGGPVEVVLNLENRSRNAIGSGREVTFEGVAASLSKNPFRLTLNDGQVK